MPEKEINQQHSESFHRIGSEEHEILTRTTMQPQRMSYIHFGYQNAESLDSDAISHCQARNEGSYHLYTNLESPSFDGQTHPKRCTDIIHLEKEHTDSEQEARRKRYTLLESLNIGNNVTRGLAASNESIYTSKVQNIAVHKSRVQREALFRETSQKLPACSSIVEKQRCINQKCERQSIKEGVDFKGRNEINSQKNIAKISTKKTAMHRSRSNGKIGNRTIPLSRSKSLNSSLKIQRCIGINQSEPMVCVNSIYEGNAPLETLRHGIELVTDRNKQSPEDPLHNSNESHCVIALDTPRTGSETVHYVNEKVEFNVNQHTTFLPNLDRSLLTDQHERRDNKQNDKEKCYLFLIYCTIMMLGTIVGAGMHSLFACAHEC
ncbi:uncharacterized protein TNCV_2333411 [Trichonephila clavipes]|nr:uncharacterized protein TNCV_2333411 [Trichonephila clavipes]